MPHFIDRRLNPRDKSLANRRRFLRRARAELKQAINEQVSSGSIADVAADHVVPLPAGGTSEPSFRHAPGMGRRDDVLPGNRDFSAGDRIPKQSSGSGRGANRPSPGGESEDDFRFVLSREEVLDLFFEDLELPDLVKLNLKEVETLQWRRAGFAKIGTPSNINVARTMRNSLGRRIALKRPKRQEVDAVAEEIARLEEQPISSGSHRRIDLLREELERLERRRRVIAFVDQVDIRFNRFEPQPLPNANAVMFCLMDVSGSMGEREKELAKRFFVLLHLFLSRRYERTDIVFIRHTHEAQEVDEQTFFYSQQSGGTIVSTALEVMRRIIAERYPSQEWNIYAAQASDGGNESDDSQHCANVLRDEIMPLCQYFAYVEIIDERESELFRTAEDGTPLWNSYRGIGEAWRSFQMTRIARPSDIYPVFRKLFVKQPAEARSKTP